MDNNKAFRAFLANIRKIEGADKIVQASVTLAGVPIADVVVGVDTVEGTEVVFFASLLRYYTGCQNKIFQKVSLISTV